MTSPAAGGMFRYAQDAVGGVSDAAIREGARGGGVIEDLDVDVVIGARISRAGRGPAFRCLRGTLPGGTMPVMPFSDAASLPSSAASSGERPHSWTMVKEKGSTGSGSGSGAVSLSASSIMAPPGRGTMGRGAAPAVVLRLEAHTLQFRAQLRVFVLEVRHYLVDQHVERVAHLREFFAQGDNFLAQGLEGRRGFAGHRGRAGHALGRRERTHLDDQVRAGSVSGGRRFVIGRGRHNGREGFFFFVRRRRHDGGNRRGCVFRRHDGRGRFLGKRAGGEREDA